jgi:hypothetical protein
MDQYPENQVHGIAGLKEAEDAWGREGGHQAASELIPDNGAVGNRRTVYIRSGPS